MAVEKSFLVVTSASENPNNFTSAVKNTGINTAGLHFSFGTTIYFKPNRNVTRQSGGIGIFTNANSNTGYFIRIKTSQTAGLFGEEIRIIKVVNGSVVKVFNDAVNVNKNTIAIQEGKSYKIDVFARHFGNSVKINAYVNGFLVQAEDTTDVVAKSSNIALFANLGSAYFDYAYALKITEAQFDAPVLTNIYDSQFTKSLISLAYGEFFANGIERLTNTEERYVEEFGSIAREIRYVKKRYDSAPSIPRFTYENLNSSVRVLYSSLMPFEAELYMINNSGTSTLVDSSLGTQINVLGNNLIKTSGVLYQEDTTNKYAAQEPIVFEADWIQNENDAVQISNFIKSQWSKSNTVLNLQVFGNPLISVYDIITISHQFSEINANQKFIVTNVNHS
ncbi:MAG: hypothetical protein ACO3UU_02250, partial [Minisyncoccia bacterium]